MDKMKNSHIKKANEIPNIIKTIIPNYDQYKKDMNSITEFEVFDRFAEKVLPSNSKTGYNNQSLSIKKKELKIK